MRLVPVNSRRGSLIVAALLLFALLLALGLGLMSSQAARMKAANSQTDSIQAKSLALAAWADVQGKLGKDLFFPPRLDGQDLFSYGEDVYDSDGKLYGSYSVMIDTRYVTQIRDEGIDTLADSFVDVPLGYYLITCVGKVGPRGEEPTAERTLYFELDARSFKVIRMHDRESL
ncbi:MAG: hypothetical protein KC800_01575 [Candidatus Eremiobacteraeota bacterium]|nr:hypothetical protein [Candidatus Eremiobacteraeota bacterium]